MRVLGLSARALRRAGAAAALVAALPGLTACQRGHGKARLDVLRADPIVRCQVAGTTPWEGNDVAGSNNGVGFGGRSPTTVTRVYHLDPARTGAVLDAYLACARDAGWRARRTPYRSADTMWVDGTKTFPSGWTATLLISAGQRAWHEQPAVLVHLTADAG